MAQMILNSAVAIIVSVAFLATAVAALHGENRAMQKIPVKVKAHRHTNG